MKIILKTLLPISMLLAQDATQEQSTLQDSQDSQQEQLQYQVITPAQQKSGFIVGIEVLFAKTNTSETISKQSGSNSSIMGRFFGGYQHYIDENLGIRALLAIQDGTPINVDYSINSKTISENILPFWIGTEFDVLWDFYSKGDHTLGLSLGLGYNFEIYHNRKATINNSDYPLPQFYQHNLYPILGLHYYYDQHQIGINYRFIGTLNSAIQATSTQNIPFKTKVTYEDYLNFSYSYRF